MNRQYVTGYDFDADSGVLTFCDSVIESDGVMTVIGYSQAHFKDKVVKEKLIEMGWTPPDGSVSWIEKDNTDSTRRLVLVSDLASTSKRTEEEIRQAITENRFAEIQLNDNTEALQKNKHDKIIKTLKRAYSLGQTYWQQADSEYSSQWKKADATEAKFDKLVEEIEQLLKES